MNEIEIRRCVAWLESLVEDGAGLEGLDENVRIALMAAAGKLSRPTREALRLRNREIHRTRRLKKERADRDAKAQTGIRIARQDKVFVAPAFEERSASLVVAELKTPKSCYVCKTPFQQVHFFYDSMCLSCAELNYRKRFQTADLTGQTALITGARLKIGYQAALMMLRAGARVIVTTRFPLDAAERYLKEPDAPLWQERLHVHGLDLRHTPSVDLFTHYFLNTYERLDILINNAAQTVRRPPQFYGHLMAGERRQFESLAGETREVLNKHIEWFGDLSAKNLPVSWQNGARGVGLTSSAELSQLPYSFDSDTPEAFPEGQLDADLQQVDRRQINSWRLGLGGVPTLEMFEVQLVNSIAPFVLCSRLLPKMRLVNSHPRHIINVSAMEGKFSRHTKTDKHPHTNMAKAALNMMTHTSARELIKDGIYMNAVDTGWVTDEDPLELSLRKQRNHDFQPPLDIVDGAARVCDPFFDRGRAEPYHGKFLKDYFPTDW